MIADIARHRKTISSPLMNTDDADQEIGDRKGKDKTYRGSTRMNADQEIGDRKGKTFNQQGTQKHIGRWQSARSAQIRG